MSSGRVIAPTVRQVTPSSYAKPVKVFPLRLSRNHSGDPPVVIATLFVMPLVCARYCIAMPMDADTTSMT